MEENDIEMNELDMRLEDFPAVRRYLERTWIPYETSFFRAHLNSLFPLRTQSYNRMERSHASIKKRLATFHGDIYRVVMELVPKIITHVLYYEQSIDHQMRAIPKKCHN